MSTMVRQIWIPLLLAMVFKKITVKAFLPSSRLPKHSTPPYSCRSSSHLNMFGRKRKEPRHTKEISPSSKSESGGLLKSEVKKIYWLRKETEGEEMKSDEIEDRHAWKKKKKKNTHGITYRWRGFRQKIRQIVHRNTIYVLQCEDDKYYVGSTSNRKQRYRQHFENSRGGSKWTRLHKPIRVIAEYNRIPTRNLMGMESQKTAEYMIQYGVNNVRGAAYCLSRDFTTADAPDLARYLGHHNQLDYSDLYAELMKVLPREKKIAKVASRQKLRNYNRKLRKQKQIARKDKVNGALPSMANGGLAQRPTTKAITFARDSLELSLTPSQVMKCSEGDRQGEQLLALASEQAWNIQNPIFHYEKEERDAIQLGEKVMMYSFKNGMKLTSNQFKQAMLHDILFGTSEVVGVAITIQDARPIPAEMLTEAFDIENAVF